MAEEAGSVAERVVSVLGQVSAQLFIGKDGCLLQAIHATSNFKIGITFGVKVGRSQLIFFNDFVGDVAAVDSHVLKNFHPIFQF